MEITKHTFFFLIALVNLTGKNKNVSVTWAGKSFGLNSHVIIVLF